MEIKFHLLGVGQHFEWEGERYVKTTPLIATQVPEGGQKFMPRAALVKVAGTESTPAPVHETPALLDSATVRNAITRYHQRCLQAGEVCAGDALGQFQSELEEIHRDLLIELNL